MSATDELDLSSLVQGVRAGDRRALARAISIAERGGRSADELAREAFPRGRDAHVIGVTGAPGAGKSTLVGRLAAAILADHRRTVAVVAIDPSSPLTGGAILGDRVRMDDVARGDGVFIRSMATRGHRGGLSLAVPAVVRLLDAAGFNVVIIETVGVGQVEVEVAGAADTTVVVVTPGWGDAIQANKAGLLELADLLVVNKADRGGADDAVRDLAHMLDMGGSAEGDQRPPILRTNAVDGTGIDTLLAAVDGRYVSIEMSGELALRRARADRSQIRDRMLHNLERRVEAALTSRPDVIADVGAMRITHADAARHLLAILDDTGPESTLR